MLYALAPCKGKAARAYASSTGAVFLSYAVLPHYLKGPATIKTVARLIYRAHANIWRAGNSRTMLTRAQAHQVADTLVQLGLLLPC